MRRRATQNFLDRYLQARIVSHKTVRLPEKLPDFATTVGKEFLMSFPRLGVENQRVFRHATNDHDVCI